jgi:hypothetical protein
LVWKIILSGISAPALRCLEFAQVSGRYRNQATGKLDLALATERLMAVILLLNLPAILACYNRRMRSFFGLSVSSTIQAVMGARFYMMGRT